MGPPATPTLHTLASPSFIFQIVFFYVPHPQNGTILGPQLHLPLKMGGSNFAQS